MMTRFRIYYAEFPFLERTVKFKSRPVLCLSEGYLGRYKIMLMAYIGTKVRDRLDSDIEINSDLEGFEDTGLKSSSFLRLHKIVSVPARKIEGEIGILPDGLQKEVKGKLKKLFGL